MNGYTKTQKRVILVKNSDQDKVAEACLQYLIKNGGKVHAQELKEVAGDIMGWGHDARKWPEQWSKVNERIKTKFLNVGIVIIPVGEYWYLLPEPEGVASWMQRIVGGVDTQLNVVNLVLDVTKYRRSDVLRNYAELFLELHHMTGEIYGKLRAETGHNVTPEEITEEEGDI
jgi:hypothetical protein